MAIVAEYQAWDSASWNWTDNVTSTAPTQQIMSKLNTFVAGSNANPGNASRQITVIRTPNSSTTANYFGFGILCASPTSGAQMYCRLYTNSATNIRAEFSTGFTDNTTNGGYGTASGTTSSDTAVSFSTTGVAGELYIAYDVAEGQEFFALGWRLANTAANSRLWMIFKDNNNEWATLFNDSGVVIATLWDNLSPTPFRNTNVGILAPQSATNVIEPFSLYVNATTSLTSGSLFTQRVAPGNLNLYASNTSSNYGFGRWANLTGGGKMLCLSYGPIWIKLP